MTAAVEAAKVYKMDVIIVPKSMVGADIKAPSIYLNGRVIAEDGDAKNGKLTIDELVNELEKAKVPKYPPKKPQEE